VRGKRENESGGRECGAALFLPEQGCFARVIFTGQCAGFLRLLQPGVTPVTQVVETRYLDT